MSTQSIDYETRTCLLTPSPMKIVSFRKRSPWHIYFLNAISLSATGHGQGGQVQANLHPPEAMVRLKNQHSWAPGSLCGRDDHSLNMVHLEKSLLNALTSSKQR
jgi:hypothetical protein